MPQPTLTKIVVCVFATFAVIVSAGFITSVFAGPEPLPDNSKEKMIQPVAPECNPRWYISLGAGVDLDYGVTDFVNRTDSNPYFEDGCPDGLCFEHLEGGSWNDVFDNSIYRLQLEVGYVLTDHIELFANFGYEGGYGGNRYGDYFSYYFDTVVAAFTNYVDDYKSWGGELGIRYFFFGQRDPWHVRPYVSISGGAKAVDHIGLVEWWYPPIGGYPYSSSEVAFKGHLYDNSVVGTGALLLGVEVPINCHWSVGLEGGVRYESQLDPSDDIQQDGTWYFRRGPFRGEPFSQDPGRLHYNRDAGDRLYCPVTGYIKYRFGGNDSSGKYGLISSGEPLSLAGYSKEKMIQPMAPECNPRWYVSLGAGVDLDYGVTDFVNTTNSGPFYPNSRSYYTEHLEGGTYEDVFDNSIYRLQLEVGYVLTDHIELFANFGYEGGYGGNKYGDYESYPYNDYVYAFTNYVDDYKSWGGELGLRYFFFGERDPWHVRPYVSISGGAKAVDHIGVIEWWYTPQNYISNYRYVAFKGHLYDDSVVGTGALLLGVEVPITCHWSVGLEGGVRYESQLDPSDDIVRNGAYYYGYEFRPLNTDPDRLHYNRDAGDRWYCPVTGYIKFRF